MSSRFLHFDRELSLAKSLSAMPLERLERAFAKSIGKRWQIVDEVSMYVIGPYRGAADAADASTTVPLRLDIEIVGRLLAPDAPRVRIEAAAEWLEMVLAASSRYRMAADLHLEASHADFEQLQHAALQESETRYRELSEQLDQRVQSQVALIEQAQRHIYQAEKMVAIGSLAAGMAHEINNPIGFIRSNLSTAARYVEQLASIVRRLRGIGTAAAPAIAEKNDIDFVLEESADGVQHPFGRTHRGACLRLP